MTSDEIIRMARKAGGRQANYHKLYDHFLMSTDALERFFLAAYEAGAAAEREAMLDLVDDYAKGNTDLKAAIRARGQK